MRIMHRALVGAIALFLAASTHAAVNDPCAEDSDCAPDCCNGATNTCAAFPRGSISNGNTALFECECDAGSPFDATMLVCGACANNGDCNNDKCCDEGENVCGMLCDSADDVCDDPHMQGLRGQAIDWSGVNGGWYSLVKDEQADLQVNVRVTSPLPDAFPDRQLVTGLEILSEGHSLAIEVKNPYTIDTDDCEGVSPCFANGGLRAIVDGEEVDGVLHFSKGVYVTDNIAVSAANLPVACRQFGGDKIWARMYEEMVHGKCNLLAESMEDWILKSRSMAAPQWCVKYITENDLADLQSTHALFKIETPTVTVRLNVGVNHQGDGELDWDGRVLPDLEFWKMHVGLDGLNIDNPFLTGLLGETARPVLDENGLEVMEGLEAFRGTVDDYRVSDALGTHFPRLDKLGEGLE